MEIKSYEDVLNLQQQLIQRIRGGRQDSNLAADTLLARKRTALEQTQATLAAAETARADVIKRWDTDLARYRQTIAQLQGEITGLEATVKSAASKVSATQASAAKTDEDTETDKTDRVSANTTRKKK